MDFLEKGFKEKKSREEAYSAVEKYRFFVLFDDSTFISPQLMMIVWQCQSIETTNDQLKFFATHSLIHHRDQDTEKMYFKTKTTGYMLHSVHAAYLRQSVAHSDQLMQVISFV